MRDPEINVVVMVGEILTKLLIFFAVALEIRRNR